MKPIVSSLKSVFLDIFLLYRNFFHWFFLKSASLLIICGFLLVFSALFFFLFCVFLLLFSPWGFSDLLVQIQILLGAIFVSSGELWSAVLYKNGYTIHFIFWIFSSLTLVFFMYQSYLLSYINFSYLREGKSGLWQSIKKNVFHQKDQELGLKGLLREGMGQFFKFFKLVLWSSLYFMIPIGIFVGGIIILLLLHGLNPDPIINSRGNLASVGAFVIFAVSLLSAMYIIFRLSFVYPYMIDKGEGKSAREIVQ